MMEAITYYMVLAALVALTLALIALLLPGVITSCVVKIVSSLVERIGSAKFLVVKIHSTYAIAHVNVTDPGDSNFTYVIYPGGRDCVVIIYTASNSKFCVNNTCDIEVCDAWRILCRHVIVSVK